MHEFDILCELPSSITQEVLDEYEIFCINQYKEGGYKMLNVKGGGSHGKWTQEIKDKISRGNKGNKKCGLPLGHKRTKESIEKMKETIRKKKEKGSYTPPALGRTLTVEHRRKISEANKGKVRSFEVREMLKKAFIGRKRSPEAIRKTAEANKGRKISKESREKSSNTQSVRPIKSQNLFTGEIIIHKNQRECAEELHLNRITIVRVLTNKGKKGKARKTPGITGNYKISYINIDKIPR